MFQEVKEVPLQAWSSPEGSRKLRFPDFMTTAQKGGKVVSQWPRVFQEVKAVPLQAWSGPECSRKLKQSRYSPGVAQSVPGS